MSLGWVYREFAARLEGGWGTGSLRWDAPVLWGLGFLALSGALLGAAFNPRCLRFGRASRSRFSLLPAGSVSGASRLPTPLPNPSFQGTPRLRRVAPEFKR